MARFDISIGMDAETMYLGARIRFVQATCAATFRRGEFDGLPRRLLPGDDTRFFELRCITISSPSSSSIRRNRVFGRYAVILTMSDTTTAELVQKQLDRYYAAPRIDKEMKEARDPPPPLPQ